MKFNDAIKLGDFVKAKELASQMDMDFLRETLFLLAYDNEEIATYGFISYLLHEEPPMNFKFIQLNQPIVCQYIIIKTKKKCVILHLGIPNNLPN